MATTPLNKVTATSDCRARLTPRPMYGRLRLRMMRSKSRDTDSSLISRKVDRLKSVMREFLGQVSPQYAVSR